MVYIIIAQLARIGVVWVTNRVARKVLKTVAIGSITFYLIGRYKYLQESDKRRRLYIDDKSKRLKRET